MYYQALLLYFLKGREGYRSEKPDLKIFIDRARHNEVDNDVENKANNRNDCEKLLLKKREKSLATRVEIMRQFTTQAPVR